MMFKSVKMLTRVKKVVRANSLVHDGYRSERFDIVKPIAIKIVGSEVVDRGGPRKQVFVKC